MKFEPLTSCTTIKPLTTGLISTASMSILINGSPSSPFKLERGLQQGDPLSPFLFILVAEIFNRMVHKAKEIGVVEEVK